MNLKQRPLVLPFIHNLDCYLLKNKPEIWSARTHLVLYYGLLFIAALAGLAFIIPDDPRSPSPAVYWIGFVALLSFIALVVWLIFLLRFNVFKRFGFTTPFNRLLTFLLYFIAIGIIVLFSYAEPFVETIRANEAYTDKEIQSDIDKMNLGMAQLEHDSMSHKWDADTVLLVEERRAEQHYEAVPSAPDTVVLTPHPPYTTVTQANLTARLAAADSMQKLNDSVYVFFECPDYALLNSYRISEHSSAKPLSSAAIYHKLIEHFKPAQNKPTIQKELAAIKEKYSRPNAGYSYYYDENSNYIDRIRGKYALPAIANSMDNIIERKHRWDKENLAGLFRIFFYITLVLTLLVFAFRHSTVRTFFLSLLAAVILCILTSLVMAFARGDGDGFFVWLFFYFLLFFGLSLTALSSRRRNVLSGIAINLFIWMLPFMPLSAVAYYYQQQSYRTDIVYDYDSATVAQHYLWAEIGGCLLLLLLLATYVHAVYKKWYAAPEE